MKASSTELGQMLPERLRLLASLLARKPSTYTERWARTIDEAFTLYTRTSAVNFCLALSVVLAYDDWPFPAFTEIPARNTAIGDRSARAGEPVDALVHALAPANGTAGTTATDAAMIKLFDEHHKAVFDDWRSSPLLRSKTPIINDIEKAYEYKLWAACITAAVPLLDHVVRELLGTTRLNASVQVLRDAFVGVAGLQPKDVMPGYAVWDGRRNPEEGNTFATSIEEDLRLPGVFLSSFFYFADRYYQWYHAADSAPSSQLNRHAIMHCASEYWTQSNVVRIITFVDLTVRLRRVLTILMRGEDPGSVRPGA